MMGFKCIFIPCKIVPRRFLRRTKVSMKHLTTDWFLLSDYLHRGSPSTTGDRCSALPTWPSRHIQRCKVTLPYLPHYRPALNKRDGPPQADLICKKIRSQADHPTLRNPPGLSDKGPVCPAHS